MCNLPLHRILKQYLVWIYVHILFLPSPFLLCLKKNIISGGYRYLNWECSQLWQASKQKTTKTTIANFFWMTIWQGHTRLYICIFVIFGNHVPTPRWITALILWLSWLFASLLLYYCCCQVDNRYRNTCIRIIAVLCWCHYCPLCILFRIKLNRNPQIFLFRRTSIFQSEIHHVDHLCIDQLIDWNTFPPQFSVQLYIAKYITKVINPPFATAKLLRALIISPNIIHLGFRATIVYDCLTLGKN